MTKIRPFEDTGGYTTFDNAIIDLIMAQCKPNTWKVVCATIRKTRGWGKEQDMISITQFMKLTGINSRITMVAAIQDAVNSGYLICDKNQMTYAYSLNRQYEIATSTEYVPVQNLNQNRYKNYTRSGTESVNTKERRKIKEIKEDIPSNICTPEFIETWEDFKLHRKQIKSPMTPLAKSKMLTKLSKETVTEAIDMLNRSIENGWKGVFPSKFDRAKQPNKKLPEGI